MKDVPFFVFDPVFNGVWRDRQHQLDTAEAIVRCTPELTGRLKVLLYKAMWSIKGGDLHAAAGMLSIAKSRRETFARVAEPLRPEPSESDDYLRDIDWLRGRPLRGRIKRSDGSFVNLPEITSGLAAA